MVTMWFGSPGAICLNDVLGDQDDLSGVSFNMHEGHRDLVPLVFPSWDEDSAPT